MSTDKPDLSRATPRPWRLQTEDERVANAALIIEAVNAYDRLIAVNAALVEALDRIKTTTFYHMTRHADERGDRKVLGEVKEIAISALKLAEEP